jgi:xanthine dehydrogenase accessory factor
MPGQLDFFERIAALGREGHLFATATVVGRRAPVSAHLGDHAIVFADGRMEGFVGGACAREIVRAQAVEAIAKGAGRLVSIRPDADPAGASSPDRVAIRMTCASEGAVDVYIEPFVRARLLVVVGATPVAAALARVGRSLDYEVVRVVEEGERIEIARDASHGVSVVPLTALDETLGKGRGATGDRAVVVASQGHYDEEAVASALRCGAPYVGLVASRARGAAVRALIEKSGVPGVAALHNPAGLDLGARTPAEVALSILAEIVQVHASHSLATGPAAGAAAPVSAVALDPVCGMEVGTATARHKTDHDGVTYYFCCAGCRARFVQEPQAFLSHTP